MSQRENPFTGEWTFNAARSALSTPAPKRWRQRIVATGNEVHVREEIVGADGSLKVVSVEANIDGMDYPVIGSPVADVIAYTRLDVNNISGIAKKNDNVSLRETLTAAPEDETLTLTYGIFVGPNQVAHGVAVFNRTDS